MHETPWVTNENRQSIRNRVQLIVGKAVNHTINEAIREYWRVLQRNHNYRFMEMKTQITVDAGDATFELPLDFKEVSTPSMSGDGTIKIRMNRILKENADIVDLQYRDLPVCYRIFDGKGHLYPTAKTDCAFDLEYYGWFRDLTDDVKPDDQAGDFLNFTYKAIEYFAIAEGLRRLRQFEAADAYERKAEAKRRELELSDIGYALSGADLRMQMEG